MRPVKITEQLSVGAQPDEGSFAGLKAQGYGGVVNARPDGEDAGQPGNEVEARAAKAAGLGYAFTPVTGPTITEVDIRAFQEAVAKVKGPVFAHCKSGTRALTLHALGEVLDGRMQRDEVTAFGEAHGYSLAGAVAWLDRNAARIPEVTGFFDARTSSIQYVVSDPGTKRCAIIDPVLDFDERSGATGTMNADALLAHIGKEGLTVEWILDTHPHADHFSAAHYLKERTGAPTAIGAHVTDMQRLWRDIYNMPDLAADGSQWDQLFAAGDSFTVGSLTGRVMFSPGHTIASVTYLLGDAAFIHDTLFMPDSGSARADFPGGNAATVWRSIEGILALPDETRLFTGHDYQPGGRHPRWESAVAEQKRRNTHVVDMTEESFVALRDKRDRTLPMPRLILHALQVNMRGGRLPEPEANGRRYLKFPLDALKGAAW